MAAAFYLTDYLTNIPVVLIFSSTVTLGKKANKPKKKKSQSIPLRQTKVLFMSRHTPDNTVHACSLVPPGLFGNTAWRFILLCEILSSPPVWIFLLPLYQVYPERSTSQYIETLWHIQKHPALLCVAFAFFLIFFLHSSWKKYFMIAVSANLSHIAPITSAPSPSWVI